MSALSPALTGRVYTVILPSGLKLINANQRLHHRRKAELNAAIRQAVWTTVTEHTELMTALAKAKPDPLFARVHILGVLHPGSARRMDPANWYPSFKAAVDGLVDAGVVEDDDHTRVLGPDMRLGSVMRGSRLALHISEVAS